MQKFSYEKGDLNFAPTQCHLCVHRMEDSSDSCNMIVKIPEEILQDQCKCPYLREENEVEM